MMHYVLWFKALLSLNDAFLHCLFNFITSKYLFSKIYFKILMSQKYLWSVQLQSRDSLTLFNTKHIDGLKEVNRIKVSIFTTFSFAWCNMQLVENFDAEELRNENRD